VSGGGADGGLASNEVDAGGGGGSSSNGDGGSASPDAGGATDPNPWPNATSFANSDPWIAKNHDAISSMHPKVLAINFINDATTSSAQAHTNFQSNIQQVITALNTGSRYHGYSNSNAPAFLQYEVAKLVDLSDGLSPPAGWNHLNSSKYPLKCISGAPYQFDYSALFTQTFADYYGIADPSHASTNLTLCQLVDRGMVHEIWLHVDGDPDPYTCSNGVQLNDFQLLEVVESKQKYAASSDALAGQFEPCAGNGCFSPDDATTVTACGRSVRILYVNGTRGPGCAVHSLGHGWESTARDGVIPYLVPNFQHFANFDLQTRLNLPFSDWYVCSSVTCLTYTGSNALTWSASGTTGTVATYDQGCGSVHFPANARAQYDDQNPFGVLSTCEHFGLKGGPGGADQQEIYTDAKSGMYDALVPDCEGGWQVYWRQSFPGYRNGASGADGKPMKNWWPYLFY
jgi:hypothetical protein